MKEKIAEFLKNYNITILLYVSLLFVGIYDSIIALTIYSVIVHILVLIFIIGLYKTGLIIVTNKTPFFTHKRNLFKIIEAGVVLIILGTLGHWYTFCISCICMILIFIYTFDIKKNKQKSKGKN